MERHAGNHVHVDRDRVARDVLQMQHVRAALAFRHLLEGVRQGKARRLVLKARRRRRIGGSCRRNVRYEES